MRIVSQDRKNSFNFSNIELWLQNNVLYAKTGNSSIVLGAYNSSERAQEVFEDIHKIYSLRINETLGKNTVYCMPKE